MAVSSIDRLGYIDWMRGLACVFMFQTHCYDAWLSPEARKSQFFIWSQLGGTFPAPAFLFLAGVSVALVIYNQKSKGVLPATMARKIMLRGAEILGWGLLLRLQEYAIALGWAPWSDLFRVDILNAIGVAMILMGAVCWMVLVARGSMAGLGISAAAIAAMIALLTPPLWTTWRMRWLPWPLESYIDGVHNLHEPQPWLFPIFPWAGFAFIGLATGVILGSAWARKRAGAALTGAGVAGAALIGLSRWLDTHPEMIPFYRSAVYDYWHTSPSFFLLRVGMLLIVLLGAYGWVRWGAGGWRFSPLRQLGRTSLLVYWVHIGLVYGKFTILPRHAESIGMASLGLLIIFVGMLLLSVARTHFRGRGAEVWGWLWRPIGAA